MNHRNTIISSIVLSVVLFVLGWLMYETVLAYVKSGIEAQVVVYSTDKAFEHHLMMSLMMGFLGLTVGFTTLFSARFSREIKYGKRFAVFSCLGCISLAITTMNMVYNLGFASRYAPSDLARLDWSISAIPLHEIGLHSGIVILLGGLLSAVSYNRRS